MSSDVICGLIHRRWIISMLGIYSCALIFAKRAGISVAMVSMTRPPFSPDHHHDNQLNSTITKTVPYFQWSETVQGIILGSSFYLYWIVPTIVGGLTDRFGGKWLAFIGVFFSTILTVITPWSASYSLPVLIFIQILVGVAHGFTYPALFHLYVQWFPPEERSKANGGIQVGVSLGSTFAYLTGGYLCETTIGWPLVFYVTAAIHVPWMILWLGFVSDKPAHDDCDKLDIEKKKVIDEKPKPKRNTPWLSIITSPVVWSSVFCKFACSFGYYMLLSKLPAYLNSVYNMKITQNGLINGATCFGYGVTCFIAPYISNYMINKLSIRPLITRKLCQSIAMITPAVCLVLITFIERDETLVTLLLVTSLTGYGFMTGGEWTIVSDFAPNYVGVVSGFTLMLAFFSGILAPYVVGLILDSDIGSLHFKWNVSFYISSALYILGLTNFWIFGTDQQQIWDKF